MDTNSERYYVLLVRAGHETQIANHLQNEFQLFHRRGITFLVPLLEEWRKKKGKWQKQTRALFSGYIIVRTIQMNPEYYYRILEHPDVFYFLKYNGKLMPLSPQDTAFLQSLLNERHVLESSTVIFDRTNHLSAKSGPLAGHENIIRWVNRKQRRGCLSCPLPHQSLSIPFSFQEEKERYIYGNTKGGT